MAGTFAVFNYLHCLTNFLFRSAYSAAEIYVDRSWEYINRSQTHKCGNRDCGRAIPRKGIHKWDLRCSAVLPCAAVAFLSFFSIWLLSYPLRPKTRGLAQLGGPPGWLEDSAVTQQGVILYVDGPCSLLWHTKGGQGLVFWYSSRPMPSFWSYLWSQLFSLYTDKKEKEIFLIYKEIHMGSVAKSYMRKGFLKSLNI